MSEGFVSLHRKILQSPFWNATTPCTREVFLWLLLEANHCDRESSGRMINRGQTFRTRQQIADGLAWKVGYRTEMYSLKQVDTALINLKAEKMITVEEEGEQGRKNKHRGLLITICNYDYYQNPDNFKSLAKERRRETRREARRAERQSLESRTAPAFEPGLQSTKGHTKGERWANTGEPINNNGNNDNKEIKEVNTYTEQQRRLFLAFQNWTWVNAPSVAGMKEPFTLAQYLKAKERAKTKRLYSIVEDMENWEGLKNNASAYKTFLTFFKRQGGEGAKLPVGGVPKLPPEEQQQVYLEEIATRKMVI